MRKRQYANFKRLCSLTIAAAIVCLFPVFGEEKDRGTLHVSKNHRYLETADSRPFFYLADTAWELFHRLNRQDTLLYLDTRQKQDFNVIQAVLLAEYDGLNEPNAEGNRPLVDNDPSRPNEAYFKHVDWVVQEVARRHLYIGLLPTWGDKVRKDWGIGPVVFNPVNAGAYGKFLGKRYKNGPNIIWILGGDRRADGQEAIWRALAQGLKQGDGGAHLITYHPAGALSSSAFWPDEPWLDFQMIQSGHAARDIANYRMIEHDYLLSPVKPVVDGELRYEDHPVNWKAANGYFDAFDVRQGLYWAVFAGAAGVTYGCHDIWQFLSDAHPPVAYARTPWKTAIHLSAANQVTFLKRLMLSRDYFSRVPDQALLLDNTDDGAHLQAARGKDYIFVYSPFGAKIRIRLGQIPGKKLKVSWYDPRTGAARFVTEVANTGDQTFSPPGKPSRENDWVLILDSKR